MDRNELDAKTFSEAFAETKAVAKSFEGIADLLEAFCFSCDYWVSVGQRHQG